MIKKPKLKNKFRCELVDSEGVFLLSETETIFLGNPLFQKIIPLLDGTRTEEEIVDKLRTELPEAYIFYALMELQQKGFIIENDPILESNLTLFCESLSLDIHNVQKRLQSSQVSLRALGSLSCKNLSDSLERSQIQVVDNGEIEIILTDDYLREELNEINRINLEKSRPWMLVKPVGNLLWIGPIFHPEKTGCWECLAQRLRNNRPSEAFIQRRRDSVSPLIPPLVDLPVTQEIALAMANNEIFKWIVCGENKRLEGMIVTYDTLSLTLQNHVRPLA